MWCAGHDRAEPGPIVIAPEGLHDQRLAAMFAGALCRRAGDRPRFFRVRTGRREHTQVAARRSDKDDHGIRGQRFEESRRCFPRQQLREDCGIHQPADDRLVGIGGRWLARAGRLAGENGACLRGFVEIPLRAERLEDRLRQIEIALGGARRSGLRRDAAHRQMTEGRLVPLAEQVEDVRALREVVVRGGGPRRLRVNETADAEKLAPRSRRAARIEPVLAGLQPLFRRVDAASRQQRFVAARSA